MFDVKSLFRHANFRLSGKWPRAFAFGKSLKERIKDTSENGSMSIDALHKLSCPESNWYQKTRTAEVECKLKKNN